MCARTCSERCLVWTRRIRTPRKWGGNWLTWISSLLYTWRSMGIDVTNHKLHMLWYRSKGMSLLMFSSASWHSCDLTKVVGYEYRFLCPKANSRDYRRDHHMFHSQPTTDDVVCSLLMDELKFWLQYNLFKLFNIYEFIIHARRGKLMVLCSERSRRGKNSIKHWWELDYAWCWIIINKFYLH